MRVTATLAILGFLTGCSLPDLVTLPPSAATLADQATVPPSLRPEVQAGLQAQLDRFDRDRSGDLSGDEVVELSVALDSRQCWTDGSLLRWFDADRDGRISRAEFASPAMVDLAIADLQAGLGLQAWNDYLSYNARMDMLYGRKGPIPGPEVRADFDRKDSNRDGYLTTWERLAIGTKPLNADFIELGKLRPSCL